MTIIVAPLDVIPELGIIGSFIIGFETEEFSHGVRETYCDWTCVAVLALVIVQLRKTQDIGGDLLQFRLSIFNVYPQRGGYLCTVVGS